eukprot:2119166-Rhodomonas_salina.3
MSHFLFISTPSFLQPLLPRPPLPRRREGGRGWGRASLAAEEPRGPGGAWPSPPPSSSSSSCPRPGPRARARRPAGDAAGGLAERRLVPQRCELLFQDRLPPPAPSQSEPAGAGSGVRGEGAGPDARGGICSPPPAPSPCSPAPSPARRSVSPAMQAEHCARKASCEHRVRVGELRSCFTSTGW